MENEHSGAPENYEALSVIITFRVTDQMDDELRMLCEAWNMSLSEVLRHFISEKLSESPIIRMIRDTGTD